MATEKNFLQTIKLEISKFFKLLPYERIIFHRILGIAKSEAGFSILLKDLARGYDIRRSAISVLVSFFKPEVIEQLFPLLQKDVSDSEKIEILTSVENLAGEEIIPRFLEFIDEHLNSNGSGVVTKKAFSVLSSIGKKSSDVLEYLLEKARAENMPKEIRTLSIEAMSSFQRIDMFEELFKINDDEITYAVYKALYSIINTEVEKLQHSITKEDRLFTYSPDNEDKLILESRVLLGKMAPRFDSQSNKTRVAYINAMLSCNHREFIIYAMKALTSSDPELISMVLFSLYTNVDRLRDPDKLFRNLIALSTERDRDNELIVGIIVKYFSKKQETRQFHILQDKLYGYITVTLETYFETYRKDFLITDVIEKSYPESFQKIRGFILEYCTPDLKKEIVNFLINEDAALINHILLNLSKWITYIDEKDRNQLGQLIEVMSDNDKKSRENSASRIDDINFEKRYLRNRIVRLCSIIEQLNISEAASPLVNIYNYLKKYPDEKILSPVIHTLSVLNYSYMLGEIEVMLTAGTLEDQKNALTLISLFTEQRSLNILLELLKNRISEDSELVETAVSILIERDIKDNVTANQLFKAILDSNSNKHIRALAVLGIGRCAFDADLDFLNTIFFKPDIIESKDVVVRAIGSIISSSTSYNRRQMIKNLQEYLKDPGITVRIYSCLLLIKLGHEDAMRYIREMLIIKNKSIQRDILSIIGNVQSLEFSFFLLTLLTEEYGISRDILPVLEKLPEEDINEIDSFVVNLFRKFEAPEMAGVTTQQSEQESLSVEGLRVEEKTLIKIDITVNTADLHETNIADLIQMNLNIKRLVFEILYNNEGVVSRKSNSEILAYFSDPVTATGTALNIINNIKTFNSTRISEKRYNIFLQLITAPVKLINEELIEYTEYRSLSYDNLKLPNTIIIDERTRELVKDNFISKKIPELAISSTMYYIQYFEIINPINFSSVSEELLKSVEETNEQTRMMQSQLEQELKKMKRQQRSASSAAIARELDNIGNKIEVQLNEIERYVQRRSTDRELIKNVRKMLANIHNLYKVEISRIIID